MWMGHNIEWGNSEKKNGTPFSFSRQNTDYEQYKELHKYLPVTIKLTPLLGADVSPPATSSVAIHVTTLPESACVTELIVNVFAL